MEEHSIEISFDDSITDINIKEDSFTDLCKKLHKLNFIVISEEIFTQILFTKVFEHIEKRCKSIFDRKFLSSILIWADNVIFKWLGMILLTSSGSGGSNLEETESIKNRNTFEHWKTRLEFSIYENFSEQRIAELFDMIVQYPDSVPALEDLAVCFQKISIQKALISSLKKVLNQRLLHPGANTSDIITQYISTIQSIKIIDPSGIVMDSVGQPIKSYLVQREDTIRCIVESFTDESNEIYQELCRASDDTINDSLNNQYHQADLFIDEKEDDDFDNPDHQWNPDPIEAHQKIQQYKDTISCLVNIYDSTDVFVTEYRSMLSNRLLSLEYDLDKEIKIIELLKLRFGETSLHNCEIMVKDMQDSKRLNTQIKKEIQQNSPIDFETLIISALFWPTFKEENFKYPKSIQNQMETFSKEYERIKNPRNLQWKKHMGLVTLDIEMEDGTVTEHSVSPILATIIMLFQEKNKISLDEMSRELEVEKEILKKKLSYWINQQIIKESTNEKGFYEIIQQQQQNQHQQQQKEDDDDDSDDDDEDENEFVPVVVEEEEEKSESAIQKEQQMRLLENFIIGMLTNFKALPLERIHMMLTMFNSEQYNSTQNELKSFLGKLQNEDKIEFDGVDYKIKK
eukprot:gene2821-3506_t